jgi:hypothetical protein
MSESEESKVWGDGWRARFLERLRTLGCDSASEYLARNPAKPYIQAAEEMGGHIAALQLEWAQFEEASIRNDFRSVAMDSLARDLCRHLPGGWRGQAKGHFDTAHAYGAWASRLKVELPELGSKIEAVWNALEGAAPPVGWKPSGPSDPIIVLAFDRGWPASR